MLPTDLVSRQKKNAIGKIKNAGRAAPEQTKNGADGKQIFTERRTTWNEIFSRNWLEKISGSDECAEIAKTQN